MNISKALGSICLLALLQTACRKSDDSNSSNDKDLMNRLTYIIDDNKFNFSYFNAGLRRTAYRNLMADPGPYTIMLPDNNAFIKAGYRTENDVLRESGAVLNDLVSYHIASGVWELNKLPFKFNQEITALTGAKMYVTRWVKNKDTILTINGTKVLTYNLPASNGLIQVLDQVLQPMVHGALSDVVAADTTLTYLNVALRQANMKEMLTGNTAYTIFAPNNNAFRALGFRDIDSIRNTDPMKLKALLSYNLFAGRKFVYDYILTTGAGDQSEQAMLNGNNIQVSLIKSGVLYTGINLKGTGNKEYARIVKANLLAGNGVVHITDQVLKENQ